MTTDEIETLIAKAADGTITPLEAANLAAACRQDPALLTRLVRHLEIDRLLTLIERDPHGRHAAQETTLRIEHQRLAMATSPHFTTALIKNARHRHWLPRLAIAASLMLLGALALQITKKTTTTPEPPFAVDGPTSQRTATATAVAVLKRTVGVEWATAASARAVGAMLPAGWLHLKAGTLQLEFLSGAQLIVEGPAALRIDTEDTAYLESGTASAYVPEPARGFKLRGPGVDVVDLGTAFGFTVGADRKPEVHVFDGEVTVAGQSGTPQKLEATKAVLIDGTHLHQIPLRPTDFPDGEGLAAHADTAARDRLAQWKNEIARLAQDPATLLCYTFENEREWTRTVTNRATHPAHETQGAIIGAGWTNGRWPGKRALELRSLGDRLRFTLPGTHPALTLMAWVRVDSLPNDYNALLLPTRYNTGSLHWTLERGGELRLTMRTTGKPGNGTHFWDGPVSGPAVSNMDFGRWLYLATTYDATTGQVTHYRDGQEIGQARFRRHHPAILGEMEFGNWGADGTQPDTEWIKTQPVNQTTRNFVGRIDELVILSRIMTPEEIAHHHTLGTP